MHNFTDETDPFFVVQHFGYEVPALMGEMMDRGYLVTGVQGNVTLVKVATESDPKTLINPDFSVDDRTRITGIETKMHALAKYLLIRDLPEVHAPKVIEWTGQVRYEIGRNIKFHTLKSMLAMTHEDAMKLAKAQADAWIEQNPDLKKFGYKEVRVRPA